MGQRTKKKQLNEQCKQENKQDLHKNKWEKKLRLNNKAENLIQITMCKRESRKWAQA